MTLGSEQDVVETEDQIFNVTTRNTSHFEEFYPYLPATYLGFLCVVGIVSNGLVIWFFAACPVVSKLLIKKYMTLQPKGVK